MKILTDTFRTTHIDQLQMSSWWRKTLSPKRRSFNPCRCGWLLTVVLLLLRKKETSNVKLCTNKTFKRRSENKFHTIVLKYEQ
jgi:hypothetical protein